MYYTVDDTDIYRGYVTFQSHGTEDPWIWDRNIVGSLGTESPECLRPLDHALDP